jgi:hypothetical protein
MSISISSSIGTAVSGGTDATTGSLTKSVDKESASAEEAFLKEAHKTPAQRIRDAILKKLGITEDQLAKMDPAERNAIEKEIAREIAEQVKANTSTGKKTGFFTDIRV